MRSADLSYARSARRMGWWSRSRARGGPRARLRSPSRRHLRNRTCCSHKGTLDRPGAFCTTPARPRYPSTWCWRTARRPAWKCATMALVSTGRLCRSPACTRGTDGEVGGTTDITSSREGTMSAAAPAEKWPVDTTDRKRPAMAGALTVPSSSNRSRGDAGRVAGCSFG
jgi:hypothetical protein